MIMKSSNVIVLCLIITIPLLNGCSEENYLISRGNRENRDGNYESAIKIYDMALEINPRNADIYYNRGVAWFKMGKLDNAIVDYTKALEINKELIEAYINRGFIWNSKGNYDFALSDYTKALQLNPNNSLKGRIYFNRASTLFGKGDYESAIDNYTEGIKIDTSNSEAYYFRAEAWYEKSNLDNAISDYTKAIEFNSKYAQAVFNRANTWHEKRDFASAIKDYEKAIELDPQNALVYNNYSALLSSCTDGKFRDGTKALKLALKAIELRPGEVVFLGTLAAAYAESGNFKEAVQTGERAITLLKKDNNENLMNNLVSQLESYKVGKPWREDVKRKDWMREYKIKEPQKGGKSGK
ncbi:MAG: tetratricopeptide repeat protein [Nitrospirae bacterium]|nr:tetratricopeptide repeat protein [Nitrospirota bacterium]